MKGRRSFLGRDGGRVALLACGYVIAGLLGLPFAISPGNITAIWPASGLAVAALFFAPRLWPGVLVGSIALNLFTLAHARSTNPWTAIVAASLAIAVGSTLQAVLAERLLRGHVSRERPLGSVREVIRFVVFGCVLACLVAPTIGSAGLVLAGFTPWSRYLAIWPTFWVGDAAGVLVVVPLVLSWVRPATSACGSWREALALAGFVLVSLVAAFGMDASFPPIIVLPGLIWAAWRFGMRGASIVGVVVSVVATFFLTRGSPLLAHESSQPIVAELALFLAHTTVVALFLAGAFAERERAHEDLVEANRHLEARVEERTAQLEEAVRARDEFLSIASHELKTPLTALLLSVQVLQRTRGLASDGLHRIGRQADRLTLVVNTLLDVTRVRSGRLELVRDRVALGVLVRDVVARMDGVIARSGGALRLDLDDTVVGDWDRFRLELVVTNLLANAVKYGAGRDIAITLKDLGGVAELSVFDAGIGIAPEALERIFAPFERAVPSRNYGGLGLGLFIVRRIVELHGGRVVAESNGSGTVFRVQLPLAADAASARLPDAAGANPA